MGKPYRQELDLLNATVEWASKQEVKKLTHFLISWNGEHVAIVGSGGSFSAATIASLFRELAHHGVTTAVTPHEFKSVVNRIMPRCLLLSAEGKNKDILQAARTAEAADALSAALTLTASNPLVDLAKLTKATRVFEYQMEWIKDGYLATNSLLAMVLLLYRAFFDNSDFQKLVASIDERYLQQRRRKILSFSSSHVLRQRGMLLLFSSHAKPFAVDLESRLSESALARIQICDLRQFAHGRHLQLADLASAPSVFIAYSVAERPLAEATRLLVPLEILVEMLEIEGTSEQDSAVHGLLDAMYLTEAIALSVGIDPGDPYVPEFGRKMHVLDPEKYSTTQTETISLLTVAARRKSKNGIDGTPKSKVLIAGRAYANHMVNANFKGLVSDFDGTLCRTENRFDGMAPELVAELTAFLRQGFKLAIATGRGQSLHEKLRAVFAEDLHSAILVGYYSGSYIESLDKPFEQPSVNEEFSELWDWLKHSSHEIPAQGWQELARGGQLGFRMANARSCMSLMASIQVWIGQTARNGWRVFCSGHSVDVLDSRTSKRNVVSHFSELHGMDANTEILRIGDCGQEGGNDFELLSEGLGLSCAEVSTSLNSCWNFGALGNSQTETTMSYLRAMTPIGDGFRFSPNALPFLFTGTTPS